MARTPTLKNNVAIATMLKAIISGDGSVSRFHKVQLVESGHLVPKKEKTEAVAAAGRGRHKINYELSPRGKQIVSLSKNWKVAA